MRTTKPTDKQIDDAKRVLRADYCCDVESVAYDLMERLEKGDFKHREAFLDAITEAVNDHKRLIYTDQVFGQDVFSELISLGVFQRSKDLRLMVKLLRRAEGRQVQP